jgi:hypothetical protein
MLAQVGEIRGVMIDRWRSFGLHGTLIVNPDDLARISHTFRDEAREFPGEARRAPRGTEGCMGTYCPRSEQAERRHDGKEQAAVERV